MNQDRTNQINSLYQEIKADGNALRRLKKMLSKQGDDEGDISDSD
jgi:hypothetical protein